MFSGKTIFIAPLDWGIGHATRCVPLIRQLEKNNSVILGLTPLTAPILTSEFPHLRTVSLPAYNVRYSATLPLWMKLLLDWPRLSGIIRKENKLIDKIVKEEKLDVIISDNRFGLHSKNAHCVFLSHQLYLKTTFFQNLAQTINRNYLLQFNEIWVPDYEDMGKSLAGELSHGPLFHPRVKYIGPLSRLQTHHAPAEVFDHLLLLSGPQPSQTLLRNAVLKFFENQRNQKCAVVSPESFHAGSQHVKCFVAPDAATLASLIRSSNHIICRSGYSSLMDLHLLKKSAVTLVPTPGQSEQLYLAEHWQKNFGARIRTQKNITQINTLV